MTWGALAGLAVVAYGFKAFGLLVLGGRRLRGHAADAVGLLPPSLLAGLVAVGTFSTDETLVLDARLLGMGFAALAAWRKWPFAVVVIGAATVTAVARLIAG